MPVKRKICVVVTARPSYSRVKTVLQAIREHDDLELQLVVAASALLDNYGNTVKYIQKDGFEIAARVYMVIEGGNLATMAKTTGLGMMELATVFDNLKPDVIMTIADRYETIATAITGAYMNITVAHLQGGEVSGTIDEKVRHAITKLADLHFVSTQKAAERVIKMGEMPKAVFVTGCPSIDLAASILDNPHLDFNPFDKYGGVGSIFNLDDYIVVMQHPVTTEYEKSREQIMETLYAVKSVGTPAIWFWPNVDAGTDGTSKGIRIFRENYDPSNMHFFKNMEPEDFLRLIYNSRCIVGNSSVAIRECSYLGIPAVNIGSREAGRERGPNVLDVPHDRVEIEGAIRTHLNNGRIAGVTLYGDGKAGSRIADLLSEISLTFEKRLTY